MADDVERQEKRARAQRLVSARTLAGYRGPKPVAEALAMKIDTYKAYEQGRNGFSPTDAQRFADLFGVRLDWLLFNRGKPQEDTAENQVKPSVARFVSIPLTGIVEAGSFREVNDLDQSEPEEMLVERDPRFPQARLLVFDIRGDSMDRLEEMPLRPGYRAVGVAYEDVASQYPLRDRMVVVVQRTRDGGQLREWSIKQIELYDDRVEFWPRSSNPVHKPIVVERDALADDGCEIEIIAFIRQAIGNLEPG